MKGETRTRETTIDTVEVWNSERDEWTEGNLLPGGESRAGATFVTLDKKPHLVGGTGMFFVSSNRQRRGPYLQMTSIYVHHFGVFDPLPYL